MGQDGGCRLWVRPVLNLEHLALGADLEDSGQACVYGGGGFIWAMCIQHVQRS